MLHGESLKAETFSPGMYDELYATDVKEQLKTAVHVAGTFLPKLKEAKTNAVGIPAARDKDYLCVCAAGDEWASKLPSEAGRKAPGKGGKPGILTHHDLFILLGRMGTFQSKPFSFHKGNIDVFYSFFLLRGLACLVARQNEAVTKARKALTSVAKNNLQRRGKQPRKHKMQDLIQNSILMPPEKVSKHLAWVQTNAQGLAKLASITPPLAAHAAENVLQPL
ncbi:hypothetical protein Y1Q_0023825 [Alligator mississippiensis]|uniref:Uncharacterized protein n=1 Tax=Alligator mississippiensis TaxID=8496 RepID=A0A151MKJ9_ALLMI|nr:hypothetical protein Y1Q_0023825 [Alligator mississippiensis]